MFSSYPLCCSHSTYSPYRRYGFRRLAALARVVAVGFTVLVLTVVVPSVGAFDRSPAAELYPDAPAVDARAAYMIDLGTGAVLYELNPDEVIPPASLTKIVGMHVVFEAVERGQVALEDTVAIPEAAWARNMPRYSSLMFLGPGQRVTLRELLHGLAIASGNDAALAVAKHIAGGEREFVALMNAAMQDLGLDHTRFVESSGLSSKNTTTAREFTRFLYDYLQKRPGVLEQFHRDETFSYPLEHNRDPENGEPTITQANRNTLLREYDGADGIKTGYIPASQYNLAFTAERDGRRLIGVLLGVPGENHAEGSAERTRQASLLLDYGFDRFTNLRVGYPEPRPVRVWFGTASEVTPVVGGSDTVTVPVDRADAIEGELRLPGSLQAPVAAGARVGEVRYSIDGRILHTRPVSVPESVPRGPWWRVVGHHITRFFVRLLERFAFTLPFR